MANLLREHILSASCPYGLHVPWYIALRVIGGEGAYAVQPAGRTQRSMKLTKKALWQRSDKVAVEAPTTV